MCFCPNSKSARWCRSSQRYCVIFTVSLYVAQEWSLIETLELYWVKTNNTFLFEKLTIILILSEVALSRRYSGRKIEMISEGWYWLIILVQPKRSNMHIHFRVNRCTPQWIVTQYLTIQSGEDTFNLRSAPFHHTYFDLRNSDPGIWVFVQHSCDQVL